MKQTAFLYTKAFSDFGSILENVVLSSTLVVSTHGNLFWLSAFFGAMTLGGLLSSLYAGVLADRYSRKPFMIASDICRAMAVGVILLHPTPITILLMAFTLGFLGSFFQIGFSAEIPQIFGEENALQINALLSKLSAISLVCGFLASIALSRIPFQWVMAIDLFSFLLSALAVTLTKWESSTVRSESLATQIKESSLVPSHKQPLRKLGKDLVEVYHYLLTVPTLLVVFLVFLSQTFAASTHNMGIPLLAQTLDPSHVMQDQGLIWGIWGIGSVLSSTLLPKIKRIREALPFFYWLMALLMSLGFISFLSSRHLSIILPFAFLTGIFDAACSTILSTLLQQTENRIRGRVFGVSSVLNRIGFFTGFVLCPLFMRQIGLSHTVWLFHGCVVFLTLLILLIVLIKRLTTRKATEQVIEQTNKA